MARIRTIKPEFPHSESMGRVSRDARLCFVEMWTIADDSGRLRGNSRMLASLLFPYDDDAPALISEWLDELERENCIVRYQDASKANYIQICQWRTHQKIDKPSESKLPSPDSCKPRERSRMFDEASRKIVQDQGPGPGEDQGPGEEGSGSVANVRRKVSDNPPTVDEIGFYLGSIGKDTSEAQSIFDFYSANGWVQGNEGKPIMDWQATARAWFNSKVAKRSRHGPTTFAQQRVSNTQTAIEEFSNGTN